MRSIEFHTLARGLDLIPHPYLSANHVPDWLKNMPADHEYGGTLKRSPLFLAAMTAGYIIPAPADARISMSATGEISARGTLNYLSMHPVRTSGKSLLTPAGANC